MLYTKLCTQTIEFLFFRWLNIFADQKVIYKFFAILCMYSMDSYTEVAWLRSRNERQTTAPRVLDFSEDISHLLVE